MRRRLLQDQAYKIVKPASLPNTSLLSTSFAHSISSRSACLCQSSVCDHRVTPFHARRSTWDERGAKQTRNALLYGEPMNRFLVTEREFSKRLLETRLASENVRVRPSFVECMRHGTGLHNHGLAIRDSHDVGMPTSSGKPESRTLRTPPEKEYGCSNALDKPRGTQRCRRLVLRGISTAECMDRKIILARSSNLEVRVKPIDRFSS
jgi:hypothetical protein